MCARDRESESEANGTCSVASFSLKVSFTLSVMNETSLLLLYYSI